MAIFVIADRNTNEINSYVETMYSARAEKYAMIETIAKWANTNYANADYYVKRSFCIGERGYDVMLDLWEQGKIDIECLDD